jgi:hypothetical protein
MWAHNIHCVLCSLKFAAVNLGKVIDRVSVHRVVWAISVTFYWRLT